jgi:aldehyde:ferredoxin oxidoreductase
MFATGAEYFQLLSSAGLCGIYTIFMGVPIVELIAPVTGWDIDWAEGLKTGKRILTLRQAFNVREGISPDMFKLPKRVTVPQQVGPAKGVELDFDAMKKSYFEAMGWDVKTGKPSDKTLAELGIDKL